MDGPLLRRAKDQWQSEYFVIRDGYLLRFHSNSSTKVRSRINLSKAVLVPSVSEVQFELQPANKATIALRADSRKARRRWEKELARECRVNEIDLDLELKDSATVVVNRSGIIVGANKALCALSGYESNELVGKNVSVLTPKSVAKNHDAMMKRYVEGGHSRLVGKPRRLKLRTKAGDEIEVVLFLSEVISNGSRHFMAVMDKCDANSSSLNINSLASAAVCCDENGSMVAVNAALEHLFGYTAEEMRDSNVSMLMPPGMRKVHDMYLARYRDGKGGRLIGKPRRVVAQRKDGSYIEVLIAIGELLENGQRMLLGTFSDPEEVRLSGDVSSMEEADDSESEDTLSSSSSSLSCPTGPISFSRTSSFSTSPGFAGSPPSGSCSPRMLARGNNASPDRISSSERSSLRRSNGTQTMGALPAEYSAVLQQVQAATVSTLMAELRRLAAQEAKRANDARQSAMATAGSSGGPSSPSNSALDLSNLVIERRLARCGGSGCTVYSVLIEGWRCAMKELDISSTNQRSIESFLKEISMCEQLPYHPNICRYLFHSLAGDRLRLFMTQYEGTLGGVLEDLRSKGGVLGGRDIVRFAQDMLQGLSFLHAQRVLHRDLKSENVFVVYDGQGRVQSLAIGDFDQAKVGPAMTMVGTPGFTAPEVLREEGYSFPADVWSFGMILYEMAALQRPYEGMGIMQMSRAMTEGPPPFPLELRPDLEPLLAVYNGCTSLDPASRLPISRIQGMLATMHFA
eukprot:TRINITY_DN31_c0_g1_i1.p1 TRINITY_DN31_c0_g1~~TRINITY_DN31_c0_g1_i1.p1  ORF type:complete len:788 (-),score=253.01 TRINITY_DN31_c0_g1_i1:210-2438(-)